MTKLTIRIGEAEITVELSGCSAEFDGATLKIHAPSTIINNIPLLPHTQQPAVNPNHYPWDSGVANRQVIGIGPQVIW